MEKEEVNVLGVSVLPLKEWPPLEGDPPPEGLFMKQAQHSQAHLMVADSTNAKNLNHEITEHHEHGYQFNQAFCFRLYIPIKVAFGALFDSLSAQNDHVPFIQFKGTMF